MILEQETYDKFGYYPMDLSQKSNKNILVKCEGKDCDKIKEISKSNFSKAKNQNLCKSCARKKYLKENPEKNPMKNPTARANSSKSHEGQKSWNKGLTKETDSRIKSAHNKGKSLEEEFGVEKAEKIKSGLSKSHLGQKGWNKGLTKETDERVLKGAEKRIGRFVSDETREKQSNARLGVAPWNVGIPHSEDSKEKNRLAHLGKEAWNKGKHGYLTEEQIEKMREITSKQKPITNSSIEQKVEKQLKKYNIENFEKPLRYTTFCMFIDTIIYYEKFNRLRAEGGVQASGTAWRSAGGG